MATSQGLAQFMHRIGSKGYLQVPDLPWRVEVEVVDMRMSYGVLQLQVRQWNDADHGAPGSPGEPRVWVRTDRVHVE